MEKVKNKFQGPDIQVNLKDDKIVRTRNTAESYLQLRSKRPKPKVQIWLYPHLEIVHGCHKPDEVMV